MVQQSKEQRNVCVALRCQTLATQKQRNAKNVALLFRLNACELWNTVCKFTISAQQPFIFNALALGWILTWTRINVFRCIVYCIIHLVILFNLFKLHPIVIMQLCSSIWRNCQCSPTIYEWVLAYTQIHHVNYCVQLSTLRWATISNTLMCTLHIYFQ